MFRFTIRDVLWLTAIVALAVAWWIDRTSVETRGETRTARIRSHAEELKAALGEAHMSQTYYHTGIVSGNSPLRRRVINYRPEGPDVNWALADRPIPR